MSQNAYEKMQDFYAPAPGRYTKAEEKRRAKGRTDWAIAGFILGGISGAARRPNYGAGTHLAWGAASATLLFLTRRAGRVWNLLFASGVMGNTISAARAAINPDSVRSIDFEDIPAGVIPPEREDNPRRLVLGQSTQSAAGRAREAEEDQKRKQRDARSIFGDFMAAYRRPPFAGLSAGDRGRILQLARVLYRQTDNVNLARLVRVMTSVAEGDRVAYQRFIAFMRDSGRTMSAADHQALYQSIQRMNQRMLRAICSGSIDAIIATEAEARAWASTLLTGRPSAKAPLMVSGA